MRGEGLYTFLFTLIYCIVGEFTPSYSRRSMNSGGEFTTRSIHTVGEFTQVFSSQVEAALNAADGNVQRAANYLLG